ncbi:RDD family protein [Gimesia aquarii]|uniref:RDD family protein n=1 Tax=Gimesia aquarii TaxID=2527964 RepID=A0A517VZ05_9PLAN|nr:RDD family protein [Gimesia aquarii]QDT98232.1 RDD family protein [Gimesia aquarii]
MPEYQHDRSLGEGVYFTSDDYIGIMRRIIIFMVDVTVLILLQALITIVHDLLTGDYVSETPIWIWLFCVWGYLTVVRASRIRTVGYWVTNSKIVNLRGNKPSVFRMTYRLLLSTFMSFNYIYDLMWSAVDEDRQSLTDRFAGTCVVKKNSAPQGRSEIHLANYCALGFIYVYQRVTRPKQFDQKMSSKENESV